MALTDKLTAIADAIRTKTGSTSALTLDQMATEINGIGVGGEDPFDPVSPFTYTVGSIEDALDGFTINDNGYYESQNKGTNNSYAICRVNLTVKRTCDIVFDVINYAESGYDYGIFGNLDSALTLSATADSSVKKSFKSEHSDAVVNLTYSGVTPGNHYIDVKFIKDSSVNKNNDSVQFKVQWDDSLPQTTIDKILAADPDLKAENIVRGVDIFGVVGSAEAWPSIILSGVTVTDDGNGNVTIS